MVIQFHVGTAQHGGGKQTPVASAHRGLKFKTSFRHLPCLQKISLFLSPTLYDNLLL